MNRRDFIGGLAAAGLVRTVEGGEPGTVPHRYVQHNGFRWHWRMSSAVPEKAGGDYRVVVEVVDTVAPAATWQPVFRGSVPTRAVADGLLDDFYGLGGAKRGTDLSRLGAWLRCQFTDVGEFLWFSKPTLAQEVVSRQIRDAFYALSELFRGA